MCTRQIRCSCLAGLTKRLCCAAAFVVLAVGFSQANLLVTQSQTLSLRKDDGTAIWTNIWAGANLQGVVVGADDKIYVADYSRNRVMQFTRGGTFVKDVLNIAAYNPIAVAYNPARPGEIIAVLRYNGGTHFARLNTGITATSAAQFVGYGNGGANYYGAHFTGGYLYVAHPTANGGLLQRFTENLAWDSGWGTPSYSNATDITSIGTNLFVSDSAGYVRIGSTAGGAGKLGSNWFGNPPPGNVGGIVGLTTDGTNIWMARTTGGAGYVQKFGTNGTFQSITITLPVNAYFVEYTSLNGNQPPVAKDIGISLVQGQTNTLLITSGAYAPTDPDGDTAFTVTAVGAVSPLEAGTAAYTPSNVTFAASNTWVGAASFTYTVSDGHGGSDTKTVTAQVHPTPGMIIMVF